MLKNSAGGDDSQQDSKIKFLQRGIRNSLEVEAVNKIKQMKKKSLVLICCINSEKLNNGNSNNQAATIQKSSLL